MVIAQLPVVSADNEWSPLRSVIVGRAEDSVFPCEPLQMMAATLPSEHSAEFKPANPFPTDILESAQVELDNLAEILQKEGIRVYRPSKVDWLSVQGYTGSIPRGGLMTVGSKLIEAPLAWRCRRNEIALAYSSILSQLMVENSEATICRAPLATGTPHRNQTSRKAAEYQGNVGNWCIDKSTPAFDAADFMRFGSVILGQLSPVTNQEGVDYLRSVLPEGYTVEIIQTADDDDAMHIDTTLLPLREGLLLFNPERTSQYELRKHEIFRDWTLLACPITPEILPHPHPPVYAGNPWRMLSALSLDEERVVVEANQKEFASYLSVIGMKPIMVPFAHVGSIGGSIHRATVDLVRSSAG